MKRAFISFAGFSLFTFVIFGLTSSDNKYAHANARSSGMLQLYGNSHLYNSTSSPLGLSQLALRNNGIGNP